MIKDDLITNWDFLSEQDKKDIANFVSKQMQKKTSVPAKQLLDELNKCAGRKYKAVKANLSLIQARLAEGHSYEDISAVIARKCLEWQNDKVMSQYLRPATLFNAEKFNQYVGQLDAPMPEAPKAKLKRPTNDTEWMELGNKVGAGRMDTYEQIWHKAVIAHDEGRI